MRFTISGPVTVNELNMKSLTLCICFLTMALSWTNGQDISSTSTVGSVGESDRKFLSDLEQANKPKAPPFRTVQGLKASSVNVPSVITREAESKPATAIKKATDIVPVKSVKPNGGIPTKVPETPMNPQTVTITKTTVATTPVYDVDNSDHGFLYRIFHRNKSDLRRGE
jgi:hypothetical protein